MDRTMKSLGYTEALEYPAFTIGASQEGIQQVQAMMRMYDSPEHRFSVILENTPEWGEKWSPAQFMLRIQEVKGKLRSRKAKAK